MHEEQHCRSTTANATAPAPAHVDDSTILTEERSDGPSTEIPSHSKPTTEGANLPTGTHSAVATVDVSAAAASVPVAVDKNKEDVVETASTVGEEQVEDEVKESEEPEKMAQNSDDTSCMTPPPPPALPSLLPLPIPPPLPTPQYTTHSETPPGSEQVAATAHVMPIVPIMPPPVPTMVDKVAALLLNLLDRCTPRHHVATSLPYELLYQRVEGMYMAFRSLQGGLNCTFCAIINILPPPPCSFCTFIY